MAANIFFLIIVIFMVCLVLMQVRNQNMKEKYAALWLSVGGVMIVLALFPKLDWFSSLVGIETPVNLLFLIAIVMLMGISLHLTLAISKLTDDARTIAEEVAIMRALQRQPEGAAGRGNTPASETNTPKSSN